MADNRMFLKDKRTGERLFLAKYYAATGWYNPRPGLLGDQLNEFLDKGGFAGLGGDWVYEVEYETTEAECKAIREKIEASVPPKFKYLKIVDGKEIEVSPE